MLIDERWLTICLCKKPLSAASFIENRPIMIMAPVEVMVEAVAEDVIKAVLDQVNLVAVLVILPPVIS